jgi:hypothetical protein
MFVPGLIVGIVERPFGYELADVRMYVLYVRISTSEFNNKNETNHIDDPACYQNLHQRIQCY